MELTFVTGNKNKLREVEALLQPHKVTQLDLEIMEIQSLDPRQIIRHKLSEARTGNNGQFMVEDTSLWLEALDWKLPGPLIRWFNDTVGNDGLYRLVEQSGRFLAKTLTVVGYSDESGSVSFFEGEVKGRIARPEEAGTFGYDPIFIPEGQHKTLAELKREGDFSRSGRGIAAGLLKEFLNRP